MSKTYLSVGMKYGDIISILPILYQEFISGHRPRLVISKDYAPLLKGVIYVTPIIYEGNWDDLRGAMRFTKQTIKEKVICLSTSGAGFPIEHRTPSFQLDAWLRAGCINQFTELRPVFDRRSKKREAELTAKLTSKKFILFADRGQSSPFLHVDDLTKELEINFPDYAVVKLSELRAEMLYDLLGVYDQATIIITTETAHLHLSGATETPVIALVTDKPTRWHGSAWHPRFKLHVRYSDYLERKGEIIQAVKDVLTGSPESQVSLPSTGYSFGYNPTCIEFRGKQIVVYRYHPDKKSWRTQLAIQDGDVSHPIHSPENFKDYSLEDGRLFKFKGKLHISYVCARSIGTLARCVVQYGELKFDGRVWSIVDHQQPLIFGNDFSGMQKNYSFWESGGKLYCAVQRSPEQVVYELDGEKVVKEHKTTTPRWEFGQMRGGTMPLDYNGMWLQFFHTQRQLPSGASWVMGALLMEKEPPFQIVAVSKRPILVGNEQYFHGSKFWKPNVAICYGAIALDNLFLISIGINDSACGVMSVTREQLYL